MHARLVSIGGSSVLKQRSQAPCHYVQELRYAGAAAVGGRLAVSTGMPLLGRRYRYLSLLGEGATAQARAHEPLDTLAP